MYYKIEVINNLNIDFCHQHYALFLLAESAGHFWWTAEFENGVNPDFENLKHLQNPEH